jgi:hypothetical protein
LEGYEYPWWPAAIEGSSVHSSSQRRKQCSSIVSTHSKDFSFNSVKVNGQNQITEQFLLQSDAGLDLGIFYVL